MKYILSQVFNHKHALSQRIVGIYDTIEECNEQAHILGFGDFAQDPNHEDAFKTEPLVYEDENTGKVAGGTLLCAILYSDLEAAAAESKVETETTDEPITDDETTNAEESESAESDISEQAE